MPLPKPVMARFVRAIHVFLDPTRHPPLDSHGTEDGAKAMGLPGAFVELMFDLADDLARGMRWLHMQLSWLWRKALRAYQYFKPRFVLIVSFASFIAALIAAWNIPVFHLIWRDDFWDVQNGEGVRNLILAAVALIGGLVGLAGYLLLAVRTNAIQRQTELQWESQITDRFTKAVEQLGHKEVAVRLGAIYALERIAKDSERDFSTIMETLAAFVRQRASQLREDDGPDEDMPRPAVDVSAAVVVIARSVPRLSPLRVGSNEAQIDLRYTKLRGLDVVGADFSGFLFDGSDFRDATFYRCSFVGTRLHSCNFTSSRMVMVDFSNCRADDAIFDKAYMHRSVWKGVFARRAKFQEASMSKSDLDNVIFGNVVLRGANLISSSFRYARLLGCDFSGASLKHSKFDNASLQRSVFSDANISGSSFTGVRNLERSQWAEAVYDPNFPPYDLPVE